MIHRIRNPSRTFKQLCSRETLEMEGLRGSVSLGPSIKKTGRDLPGGHCSMPIANTLALRSTQQRNEDKPG